MQRILVALSCALIVLAAPTLGFALQADYCRADVTCYAGTGQSCEGTACSDKAPCCAGAVCQGPAGSKTCAVDYCNGCGASGAAPHVVGRGGISHPEVVPIFWGSYADGSSYWANPSVSYATRSTRFAEVQYLVNGPYFAALDQYFDAGFSTGRMVPGGPISASPNPLLLEPCTGPNDGSCAARTQNAACVKSGTSYQCRYPYASSGWIAACDVINAMNGVQPGATPTVPPPSPNMLYLVVIPPGSVDIGFAGGGDNFSCAYGNPTQYYKGAFVHGDDMSEHEMAEAITGNVYIDNCYNGNGTGANQIADICQCRYEVDEAKRTHQAYWSASDAQCVIPEAWDGVYKYTGGAWSPLAPVSGGMSGARVRQLYASPGLGLIATKGDDDLYQYASGAWNSIDPSLAVDGSGMSLGLAQGGVFAAGPSSVLALGDMGNQVYRWDATGGPNAWTTTSFGEASAVYSGAFALVVDPDGNPFSDVLGTGQTWGYVGPAGGLATQPGVDLFDQLLVGDTWAAALDLNHNAWLISGYVSGSGTPWQEVNAPSAVTELFVAGHTLAARDPSTPGGLYAVSTTSGTTLDARGWQAIGDGTATDLFAVTGEASAPFAATAGGSVMIETSPLYGTPAWPTPAFPGSAGGRIVGQGSALYATGGRLVCLGAGDKCTQGTQCCSLACNATTHGCN